MNNLNKISKTISYSQKLFLTTSLRQIGFNPKNNGTFLIKQAIIYVYKTDIITINLEKIYKFLASKNNLSSKGIESLIRYSFYNINTKKLITNYEKIFGIKFDFEYFNLKTLINDFIDLLENQEK